MIHHLYKLPTILPKSTNGLKRMTNLGFSNLVHEKNNIQSLNSPQ